MSRVRRREMERLFSPLEVETGGSWPVAPRYLVRDGVIRHDDDPGDLPGPPLGTARPTPWAEPQFDPEAFLSFARLAARGKPSQGAILRWVHRYGLLYRLEPDPGIRDGLTEAEIRSMAGMKEDGDIGQWLKRFVLNQKPMDLEEFRNEARYAYLLLRLYEMLRDDDNGPALRERLARDSPAPYQDSPQGPFVHELIFGELFLDKTLSRYKILDDDGLRQECWSALYTHIERQIEGVRHTLFGSGVGLQVDCPDVRTALYWQFACLVSGKRQTGICEVCGGIFEKTRRDKKVCNSSCRSRKCRKK